MNKTERNRIIQGTLYFLFIVLGTACEQSEVISGTLPLSDKQDYTMSLPEIDFAVLEQLREDSVFQLMVGALDVEANSKILDSLNKIAKDSIEYDSLLTAAIRRRESTYLSLYEAKRSSYPVHLCYYLSYECNLRYKQARQLSTRGSDITDSVWLDPVIVTSDAPAIAREMENLRINLKEKYWRLYKMFVVSKCNLITEAEVYMEGFTLSRMILEGRWAGHPAWFIFMNSVSLSQCLMEPVTVSDLLYADIMHECSYSGPWNDITRDMLNYLDMYIEYEPYRGALIWDLSCHCDPKCGTSDHHEGSGGSSSGNKPADPTPPNANNFKQKILTPAFKSRIKAELGVDPDKIPVIVDLAGEVVVPTTNAAYKDSDGSLYVSPNLFTRDWTLTDMESIFYHEYVHARQHQIDGILLPRDGKGFVIGMEYKIPTTLDDVKEAEETFGKMLDNNGVPRDASQRTAEDEQFYQTYKSLYIDPVENDYKNGVNKIVKCNKELVQMEIEAYQKQLDKYGHQMSDKCREMTENNITSYQKIWSQIKNQ